MEKTALGACKDTGDEGMQKIWDVLKVRDGLGANGALRSVPAEGVGAYLRGYDGQMGRHTPRVARLFCVAKYAAQKAP